MIYTNLTNKFEVLDFVPTHSQLLIRSLQNKDRKYNIDLIFKPVTFMIIPCILQGVEISLEEDVDKLNFLNNLHEICFDLGDKVFSIKTADQKNFYVVSMAFGIYHNELSILETSIDRFNAPIGDEIIWLK